MKPATTQFFDNGDGRHVIVKLYYVASDDYRPEDARIQMGLEWDAKYKAGKMEPFQMFPAYFAEQLKDANSDFCMHLDHGRPQRWSTVNAEAMKEISQYIRDNGWA